MWPLKVNKKAKSSPHTNLSNRLQNEILRPTITLSVRWTRSSFCFLASKNSYTSLFSALLIVLPLPQNHSLYYHGRTIQTWIFRLMPRLIPTLSRKKYVQMRPEHISGCRKTTSGKDWIFYEPKKVFNVIRPLKLSSVVLYVCVWGLYFSQELTIYATPRWERGTTSLIKALIFLTWRLCTWTETPTPTPSQLRPRWGIGLTSVQILTYPTLLGA